LKNLAASYGECAHCCGSISAFTNASYPSLILSKLPSFTNDKGRKPLKKKTDKAPFSFLPEKAQEDLHSQFSSEKINRGTILLVQEISPVEKFLILSQGSAQYYFEQNNEKTLQGHLNEGDNFGGISILLNDAVSVRTLEVLENSVFLSLDVDIFLKICTEFEKFKAYFTNTFGKLMP
jgi:CBS domain-containing protein